MAYKEYYVWQFYEDIKYALDWLFIYAQKQGKKLYGWSGEVEAVNDWIQVNQIANFIKHTKSIMWLKKYIIKNCMR